jgi:hypothetical protein
MQLQAYRSHKVVHAAEVANVNLIHDDASADLLIRTPDGVKLVHTSPKFCSRATPRPGDFYVVYDRGTPAEYDSFSPRAKFLAGYAALES